ncbi:hypothetical protein CYMTET_39241 [Cymbomonas tetramitiformis]|uniref:Uncharacterized protein n=1 Tax=Cymbomonas tetramitiformis TaxID=36881 RepID=A0AAE0CAG6_9CHLO|nr:hypothetical protein CYMTET_39241 [Cymbomonas tetramitiformis]
MRLVGEVPGRGRQHCLGTTFLLRQRRARHKRVLALRALYAPPPRRAGPPNVEQNTEWAPKPQAHPTPGVPIREPSPRRAKPKAQKKPLLHQGASEAGCTQKESTAKKTSRKNIPSKKVEARSSLSKKEDVLLLRAFFI